MRRWVLILCLCCDCAGVATAAIITVDTNVDDITVNGNCTLREAVIAANTNAIVDQCNDGDASGTVRFEWVNFTGNQALEGGAVAVDPSPTGQVRSVVFSRCIFSQNSATGRGGGFAMEYIPQRRQGITFPMTTHVSCSPPGISRAFRLASVDWWAMVRD